MLADRYRPSRWSEVVGQPKALATLARLGNLSGRSYWISGQSGTGKTTIARLIAQDVADHVCVDEFDAGELTPARVRELERELACRGLGKGGRAVIVNEAHGLRSDTQRALLVALERIPAGEVRAAAQVERLMSLIDVKLSWPGLYPTYIYTGEKPAKMAPGLFCREHYDLSQLWRLLKDIRAAEGSAE